MEREIREIERDGRTWTAIRIGRDDFGVPKHLMQGEKMEGIITDGSSIRPWYWEGFATIDDWRYVYFERCDLEAFDTIATVHRKDALELVNKLAFALSEADSRFLDLSSGVFPTYRIFILSGRDILLLPPDLADIFSIMIDEETKNRESTALVQGSAEAGFRLVSEMAQLLYYAAAGTLPFLREESREAGYKELPLSLYQGMDAKTEGLISFILHAKSREMRDIMGNRSPEKVLPWFLERSKGLGWNLEDRSEEERLADVRKAEESPEAKALLEKIGKAAKRRAFWRVKGTVITVSVIAAAAIISFLVSYISGILEPPYTRDMEPVEIIEAVYQAQNDLDPQALDAPVKGAELPQSMEVTNLYVTSRTRMAYEAVDPIIDANDWIDDGCPSIPASSFIYGVVLESIEQTGENEYTATGVWYVPAPYEEDVEVEEAANLDTRPVYLYSVRQGFTFAWNDGGWWNIVDSEILGYENLGVEEVGIYAP